MFEHYLNIFITTVFIENIALSLFLGMCTFIAISKKIDAAFGLGVAVIVVCLLTVPLNNLIYNYILREDALTWLGIEGTNLEFVELISYIGVIAYWFIGCIWNIVGISGCRDGGAQAAR